eukprot:TRINITY_DN3352_c0_g2_i1.p1 TRINITY_DN3352_c0_g2~~TRINITY_DN3352_c0_g2_i1.p1  ORF type:complete len:693 (-),score=153.11 TRINITY_DN3352_c0_g2_i1:54-2132(-)
MKSSLTLLLLFGCTLVALISAQCSFVPNASNGRAWIGPVSNLQDCASSIPASPNRKSTTLTVLRQMVDLYSFTDIAVNSGAPWNMNVDLVSGLNTIEAKSYSLDYEFHKDLTTLFNGLNDAHTWYSFPAPYSNMAAFRPFGVRPIYDGSKLRFYLTQSQYLDPSVYQQLFNFNPNNYYGDEVTQIEGTDVVTWFKNYANTGVGNYKDNSVRFNAAIKLSGQYIAVTGDRGSIVDAPTTETMVINGNTVSVPLAGALLGSLSSQADAINQIDTPRTSTNKKRVAVDPDMEVFKGMTVRPGPDIHREKKELLSPLVAEGGIKFSMPTVDYSALPSVKPLTKRGTQASTLAIKTGTSSNLELTSGTQDGTIWRGLYTTADGNNVPVLRITSFAPNDVNSFLTVVSDFADLITNNKFDRVIVDVSGNGGGIICLAYSAMSIFSSNFRDVGAMERYDLRRTDMNINLHNSRYLNGTDYRRVGSGELYGNDESWFDARTVTRGGQSSDLTQFVLFPAECLQFTNLITTGHYPSNIVLLTDGTCGSACSLFLSKFIEYGVGQVVSYGGFTDTGDMDTSSFAGGNVLDWPDFVASTLGFSLNPAPASMQTSAFNRFNHHEMYMGTTATVPREWRKMPAAYHMYFYDAIVNDDVTTADGVQAAATLYESAVGVFGSFTQRSSASLTAVSSLLVIVMSVILL